MVRSELHGSTENDAWAHTPCSPRQNLLMMYTSHTASRVADTCPAPAVSYAAPTAVTLANTSHTRRTRASRWRQPALAYATPEPVVGYVSYAVLESWKLSLPDANQENLSSPIQTHADRDARQSLDWRRQHSPRRANVGTTSGVGRHVAWHLPTTCPPRGGLG